MAALDLENRRGSGKNLRMHFELPKDEDPPITCRQHSSSSISSESSLESGVLEKDAHGIDTFESEHAGNEFPASSFTSQYAYPSPVWSFHGASAQSPTVQMMCPPGYDPNRIPASIFGSKPSGPMEWSLTSNESLISLHIGNSSFSRDHIFALNKFVESPSPDELISKSTILPPVEKVVQSNHSQIERHSVSTDTSEKTEDVVMVKPYEPIETSAESATVVLHETPDGNNKESMAPSEEARNFASVSYRSEESNISTRSFQFPLLAVDGGTSSSVNMASEKQEVEEPLRPPSPETKKRPKRGGINWWYCFSCCSRC